MLEIGKSPGRTPLISEKLKETLKQELSDPEGFDSYKEIQRWHRKQNKFGKIWEQTEQTVRLAIAYFNWIWINSRKKNTAAQRAGLSLIPWTRDDLITYPTLI